jgi:hypothetical protein
MNAKQLKDVVAQVEALKTPDASAEFQAGVDAAREVFGRLVQEALDRERIQKLETELAQLRARYPDAESVAPKRRGRRPKALQTSEAQPQDTDQS